jgi:hypothetical protein
LVNPGLSPSPHLHQVVGGVSDEKSRDGWLLDQVLTTTKNAFNISMDPAVPPPNVATCTTCQFTEDMSNYWTAVMYFKARNGSYHRVAQKPNVGFDGAAGGGMTIYYIPYNNVKVNVTAFRPVRWLCKTLGPKVSTHELADINDIQGFRMLIGQQQYRTKAEASKFRQLTYTCLQNAMTRTGETMDMPTKPCPAGIMANIRFPT